MSHIWLLLPSGKKMRSTSSRRTWQRRVAITAVQMSASLNKKNENNHHHNIEGGDQHPCKDLLNPVVCSYHTLIIIADILVPLESMKDRNDNKLTLKFILYIDTSLVMSL